MWIQAYWITLLSASTATAVSVTSPQVNQHVEKRAVNATRVALDRIIRTYEWQQYSYQALACLNAPDIYNDCSLVSTGSNIPSLTDVIVQDNSQEPASYNYPSPNYGYITFYGFGITNYTAIEPQLINITTQAMYYFCQSNSTCAQTYNATAGIDQSLLALVQQNSGRIKAILAHSATRTWIPSPDFANGLSFFTRIISGYGSEYQLRSDVIYGDNSINRNQIIGLYALLNVLNGGAQMFESLLNTVALVDLSTSTNTTKYTKRQFAKSSIRVDSLAGTTSSPNTGFKSQYLDVGSALGKRATCDANQSNLNSLSAIATFTKLSCSALGSTSLFNTSAQNGANLSGKFSTAAGQIASGLSGYLNNNAAIVGFVDGLCNLLPNNAPCYTSSSLWTSVANAPPTIVNLLSLAFNVGLGPTAAQATFPAVGCALAPYDSQAFQNAANCCSKNCNDPACQASYSSGTVSGLGC